MTTTEPNPTGLDYQAAYAAMYPGLAATTVKVHELNDQALKVVDRAARLRRAERERALAPFRALADQWAKEHHSPDVQWAAQHLTDALKEIR